jgi:hypothetical protein
VRSGEPQVAPRARSCQPGDAGDAEYGLPREPQASHTLHRLCSYAPGGPEPRRCAGAPLRDHQAGTTDDRCSTVESSAPTIIDLGWGPAPGNGLKWTTGIEGLDGILASHKQLHLCRSHRPSRRRRTQDTFSLQLSRVKVNFPVRRDQCGTQVAP